MNESCSRPPAHPAPVPADEGRTSPTPVPPDGTAPLFYSGFATIAVEVMLLREVFTALYGSDVAVGFALGCWTLFGGIGAWIGTAVSERLRRVNLAWGLAGFFAAAVVCFLGARAWGARDILRFADYVRVPLYVGPAAAAGGLLFPWILVRSRPIGTSSSRAYAVETAGGLWAGLVVALYLWSGGRALPVLLLLPAAAAPLLVAQRSDSSTPSPSINRRMTWTAAACTAALAAAATGLLRPLVLLSLKLHYPGYTIIAHENTPSVSLTAVRRNGKTFVFENGLPVPSPETTRDDLTVLALAAQFPEEWRNVFVLRPVSTGYAEALRHYAQARVVGWEPDGRKVAFLARTLGEPWTGLDVRIEPSPWRVHSPPADLLLVLSDLPHSLAENRWLTREFFEEAAGRLAPGGACITALPAAPGYVHPRRERVIASIQKAMTTAFPSVIRLHTDAGRLLLIGTRRKTRAPLQFHADRFQKRMCRDVDAGIAADAAGVFLDAALSRSLARSGAEEIEEGRAVSANSVFFPVAYYESLRFRGAMIETARGFWDRVFRRMPGAGRTAIVLLLLLSLFSERRCRGASSLFWSSWSATMALGFSLYLCQCVFGEAYWLLSLVTAAGMAGVCLGALRRARARWWGALAAAFIPMLFVAWGLLHRLPPAAVVAIVMAGNVLIGARVGTVFRRAARSDPVQARTGGFLFGLDLTGAAMGLMFGSVLLPWWMGFRAAGAGVFAAVLAAEFVDAAFPRLPRARS